MSPWVRRRGHRKVEVFLKILGQIGILFAICWLGQCIEQALPFSFPASVIGLVLLLVLLLTKVLRVEHIREKSDFLLGNLPFFFVPAVVSIMNYAGVIRANLVPFLTICVVSLFLTYGATVWTVRLVLAWMRKKEASR